MDEKRGGDEMTAILFISRVTSSLKRGNTMRPSSVTPEGWLLIHTTLCFPLTEPHPSSDLRSKAVYCLSGGKYIYNKSMHLLDFLNRSYLNKCTKVMRVSFIF